MRHSELIDFTLEQAAAAARDTAVRAGSLIRSRLTQPLGMRVKDASGDLVSDLDIRAEKMILRDLRRAFPRHRVLAEESGEVDGDEPEWCWFVDPLDGTNNLAVGLQVFSIGIALCHYGTPVLGVVHEPMTGHTWSAVVGHGATGPDGPVRHTTAPRPGGAPVLAWLQGYPVGRADATAQALRLTLEANSRRLIQLWSPQLCWIMVGRGLIHGFVGYRAGLIDFPAGSLFARECGIEITDFDRKPLPESMDDLNGEVSFLAGELDVIDELAQVVKSVDDVVVTGLPSAPNHRAAHGERAR
ncbi:inositol monophosphatase family protein [Nocardia sp. NPDC058640]|uniref:inositol monophosphatase family protein n=1 Tax=Nocardia sp. NPDC058640 TaxID=3346571 RepID=UPI00365B7745